MTQHGELAHPNDWPTARPVGTGSTEAKTVTVRTVPAGALPALTEHSAIQHSANIIMRPHHSSHSFPSFPIYSAVFLSEDLLVLGGGGGASKTGIKNELVRSYASYFPFSE